MVTQRLKELRKQAHQMTQAEAAERLGIAPSTFASYEQGTREPDNAMLKSIADLFHVSTDYLLGKVDQPDPLDKLVATAQKHMTVATEPIQVYGTIHAGNAAWADEDIIGELMVTPHLIQKYGRENLFALKITGESMNKRIPNGYVALFSRDCEVNNGDVVAVLIDGEDAMVKVYERTSQAIIFKPDSWIPGFKSYIYHKSDEQDFQILGKYIYSTDYPI